MSAPPDSDPPGFEKALSIPDKMMVFRSNQASAPSLGEEKMNMKSSKARLKLRKSTPAPPPTKGGGRKRLDSSPFPEDKQVCKRLVFDSGNNSTPEGTEDADENPPANPCIGVEGSSVPEEHGNHPKEGEQELRVICFDPSILEENPPDSGQADAGDVMAVMGDEDNRLVLSCLKDDESTRSNQLLIGERVNLPEMEIETNPLSKSSLVSSHMHESHVALAVGYPMQPKHDTILLLASLDTLEMLDNAAAQPLLAGGLPENDQMAGDPATSSLLVLDSPASSIAAPSPNPQPIHIGARKAEGNMTVEPQHNRSPNPNLALGVPVGTFEPPLEDFPPLGKR